MITGCGCSNPEGTKNCDCLPPWFDFTAAKCDESRLGMDRNHDNILLKKTWQGEARKAAIFGADKGGIEKVRLRMDWQREAAMGGEKGLREMTSARSRWWRQSSANQNRPENFKETRWSKINVFSRPVASCTFYSSIHL